MRPIPDGSRPLRPGPVPPFGPDRGQGPRERGPQCIARSGCMWCRGMDRRSAGARASTQLRLTGRGLSPDGARQVVPAHVRQAVGADGHGLLLTGHGKHGNGQHTDEGHGSEEQGQTPARERPRHPARKDAGPLIPGGHTPCRETSILLASAAVKRRIFDDWAAPAHENTQFGADFLQKAPFFPQYITPGTPIGKNAMLAAGPGISKLTFTSPRPPKAGPLPRGPPAGRTPLTPRANA